MKNRQPSLRDCAFVSSGTSRQVSSRQEAGGILAVALLVMGVLSMIATVTLYEVGNRHANTFHSLSWQEALTSAETGIDLAVKAMNDSLGDPATAWAAWSPNDATTFPKTWTPSIPDHAGEGNRKVFATVTVDNEITDASGSRWLRVRSKGVTEISGTCRAGLEGAMLDASGVKNHRGMLRKVRFTGDVTGGALRLPQIARTVEVMAAPVSSRLLSRGLTVRSAITMTGSSSIDSFDSTDPAKSTGGLYDPAKRQAHGNIVSNAPGNLSDLNNRFVWGSVFSNGGAVQETANVQGSVSDNFATAVPAVDTPNWPTVNVAPNTINNPPGGMTLIGGPSGAPQNYKVTALNLNSSAQPLILAAHAPGQESYVNIWVTGSATISSTGFIEQRPGVHVTIFCEGNVTVGGGGIVNQTGRARNLHIFGVDPATGSRSISVSGSNDFVGVINAPAYDLAVAGLRAFSGAAIARSAALSASGGFHYDEDLSNVSIGAPTSYEVVSWIEDVR
jgi:hypothetical protein